MNFRSARLEKETFKVAVSKMMVKNNSTHMLGGQKDVNRILGYYRTQFLQKDCFHHPILNSSCVELSVSNSPSHSHLPHMVTRLGTTFPRLTLQLQFQGYILTQFLNSSLPDTANILLDGLTVSNHLLIQPSYHLHCKDHFITDTLQ